MNKGQTSMTIVFGLILIVMGVVFIFFPQFGSNFWLLFIWLPGIIMEEPGIIMEERGLHNRISGLLVPAGVILTTAARYSSRVLQQQAVGHFTFLLQLLGCSSYILLRAEKITDSSFPLEF